MSKLLSVIDAQNQILADLPVLNSEVICFSNSLNRVTAKEIVASFDMPPCDNSSMDGFAFKSSDTNKATKKEPIVLSVVGDIAAGDYPIKILKNGESMRIATGGILPQGADSIIPIEETNHFSNDPGSLVPEKVKIYRKVQMGEHVRHRGQDIKKGDLILNSNIRLNPQDIGAIVSQGYQDIMVFKRPTVGVFSTGNELLKIGQTPHDGKIYDSNYHTLSNLITAENCLFVELKTSEDKEDTILERLNCALENKVDIIVSSGGVSMGAHDYVRKIIRQKGEIKFWRVNMRPGKPFLYGRYKGIPYFGLPGNPVSSYISFMIFIKPALNKLSGLCKQERFRSTVILKEDVVSDGRESFLRATIRKDKGTRIAELTGHQGSGNLYSLTKADALIIIPPGVKTLAAGSEVEAWFLNEKI